MEAYPIADTFRTTGRDAEKIFLAALPSDQFNDVKIHGENDFGLDYRIETIEQGNVPGFEFFAQVKGFSKLDVKKDIPVRLAKRTLYYWRNKLTPILIVAVDVSTKEVFCAWFDKQLDISIPHGTKTIIIPRANKFSAAVVLGYLGHFYSTFSQSLQNSAVRTLYLTVFYWSTRICATVLNVLLSLQFKHVTGQEEEQRDAAFYGLMWTMNAAVKDFAFVNETASRNMLDPSVVRSIEEICGIHKAIIIPLEEDQGTGQTVLFNRPKAIESLPLLSSTINEINLFLSKYLAGAHDRRVANKAL